MGTQIPSLRLLLLNVFSCFVFTLMHSAIANEYPTAPDTWDCRPSFGRLLQLSSCRTALDNIPRGKRASIFSTRARTAKNNWVQVPGRYTSGGAQPRCVITIDFDGHSQDDVFVVVPYDEIRKMAQKIVNSCVGYMQGKGGFITYGVGKSMDALIDPIAFGGNPVPSPARVQQPDGTVDDDHVAIPLSPASSDGYSEFWHLSVVSRFIRAKPSGL